MAAVVYIVQMSAESLCPGDEIVLYAAIFRPGHRAGQPFQLQGLPTDALQDLSPRGRFGPLASPYIPFGPLMSSYSIPGYAFQSDPSISIA